MEIRDIRAVLENKNNQLQELYGEMNWSVIRTEDAAARYVPIIEDMKNEIKSMEKQLDNLIAENIVQGYISYSILNCF